VGWFSGGGHGPLSTSYGMGSDNLLEASLVTPNGTVITANSCQNKDIFYAIRGGGGGTYGVITSATMKVYPSPRTTLWTLSISQRQLSNDTEWWDLMAFFQSQQASLKAGGLQGYYFMLGPQIMGTNAIVLGFYLYDKPNGTVESLFKPLRQKLDEMSEVVTYNSTVVSGASFMEVYEANIGKEPVAQGGFSLGSRLLPAQALEDTKTVSKTLEEIMSSSNNNVSVPPLQYRRNGLTLP
jgi:hypothetical protein